MQGRAVYELMFELIGCAVCGKELSDKISSELTPEVLRELYELSKRQDLTHIIAEALLSADLIPNGAIKDGFAKQKMAAVYRYTQIKYELARLTAALDEAKIKHILLKGSVIRRYYPRPELRTSCDIDVYVDEADIPRASEVLEKKLSYRFDLRSAHDVAYYSESKTHVELHFDLIENDSDTKKMLSKLWDGAVRESEYGYVMSREMLVAYNIAHMAKHFVSGGCGIRPFIDLWILKNKMGYDEKKAEALLSDAGLTTFAKTVMRLSDVWFSGAEHTALTREVEEYILGATLYGSTENRVAISEAKRGGKGKHLISRIFLPYNKLKRIYPRLEKYPILLPFYEVKRWGRLLFGKRAKRAIRELRTSATLSDEKKERILSMWDALELD